MTFRTVFLAGSLLALAGCVSKSDPSEKFACQWQVNSVETPRSVIEVSPDLYDKGMAAALAALVRNISQGGAGPYFAGNFYAVPGMDSQVLRTMLNTEDFVDGEWGTQKIPRPTLTDLSCHLTMSVPYRQVDNPECIETLSTFLKEGHRFYGHRNAEMTRIHHIYRAAFTRDNGINWRYLAEELPSRFNFPKAVFSFLGSRLTVISREGNTIVEAKGATRTSSGGYRLPTRTLDNGIIIDGAINGDQSFLTATGSFGRLEAEGKCSRVKG